MKKMKKFLWVLFLCMMTIGIFRTEGMSKWSIVEVSAAETLAAPKLWYAEQKKETMNMEIGWKAVKGAEGYRVYRKSGSKWKALKTVKGKETLSYIDTTCKKGQIYTYTVRAYRTENGEKVLGAYDGTGVKGVILDAPELVSITSDEKSVTIKWNPVSYASGYRIYSWDEEKDGIHIVGTVSGKNTTSYTDVFPSTGEIRYYTVSAYKKSGSKLCIGAYDTVGLATIIMEAPEKVLVSATEISEITVTWDKVYESDGYRVYRKKKGGSWVRLATLSGKDTLSYQDKTVKLGEQYYYKVRAWKYVDGTKYWSSYTEADAITMKLPTPELISAEVKSATSIQIKWKAIDKVYGYRVYRRYKGATTWNRLATLTGANKNSYTDTTVECGGAYEYTVRAYIRKNNENVWGTYNTTGVCAEIKIPAPKLVSAKAAGQTSIVLKWKTVDTAAGYRVYQKKHGAWNRIATIEDGSKTSYTAKGLDVDSLNTFTVRAYKKVNGKTVLGKYSSAGITGRTKRGTLKLSCTKLYMVEGDYSRDLKLKGTTENPQWISSNPEVVSVSSDGYLHAKKVGTATITAIFEGVEYKCKVTVDNPTLIATKEILDVGESIYVTMTGTSREVKWCTPENGNVKLKIVDTYKVKITGLKIGEERIEAKIDGETYYVDLIVKGEITVSSQKATLKVGETIEVSITSTYSEIHMYVANTSYVDTELVKLGKGKWTLKLTGLRQGEVDVEVGSPYYKEELEKKINVTVKDSNTVSANIFRLKRYIQNNGSYSNGWHTISYAGYMEDVPGITYIWTISYNKTSDKFEYALILQSDDEILCMVMTGNPAKSKTMKLEYAYETASGEKYLTAQASLNRTTYTGQNLTFTVKEVSGLSKSEKNELLSIANDTLALAFGGWEDYVLPKAYMDFQRIGFKIFSTKN